MKSIILGLASCLALVAARPVAAQEFRLHIEPAVGLWVDAPQSDRFTPGLYLAVRPGVALGRVVELQWSYALLYTPAAEGYTEDGTAHFLTTGVRLRPLGLMQPPEKPLAGLFLDLNLGYVRTDELDRFGFDVGVGYAFQLSPVFSLGLVLRYAHIVQPNTAGFDANDGQLVTVGLDFGFGPAYEPEAERACAAGTSCPPQTVCPQVLPCADRDADGVCDAVDRCPNEMGPPATLGCAVDPCRGPPLVMLVQFKYDSSELPTPRDDDPQTMDPILDAVARAMAQDPSCRVCIVGFASEEGAAEYNEGLSRRRADAVQHYLNARGLAHARTPTTGLGARCQLVPATSLELNRRVEFRRLQENEMCPLTCAESYESGRP